MFAILCYSSYSADGFNYKRDFAGIPLEAISHIWEDEEPNNKNNAERCIALNTDGKISDVNCDIPRPYMCYRANSLVNVKECGTPDKGKYKFGILIYSKNLLYIFHIKYE